MRIHLLNRRVIAFGSTHKSANILGLERVPVRTCLVVIHNASFDLHFLGAIREFQ
jgi:DNA polymerase III epsilon subunit-like protein